CVGQYVLTQPPSVSVRPGETVSLTCTGEDLTSKHYVYWFQQTSGSAPRQLIYGDTNRTAGTPDRFSGANANDVATLTISGTHLEDEAAYYC
ncbi:hypothetical protein FKM82_023272, partial [Ascaphus truei]